MAALLLGLSALVFLVAFLYSSVGHGGASGYLAVLSFFAFRSVEMASSALVLNVLVASTAWYNFSRAGHFSFRLLWPFAVMSVPAAFVGGYLGIEPELYRLLLAGVLLFAAVRLAWNVERREVVPRALPIVPALLAGVGIGFLSGVVGVGGGIFLSPVMLLMRWASVKQTAATSAGFIVVNSLSGLTGRFISGNLEIGSLALLIPTAFLGGLIGSRMGARQLSGLTLRRLLALVLLTATVKLVLPLL